MALFFILAWGACKKPDSAYLLGFLGDHKNETDTATGLESTDILASSCYFQMQKEFSRPYSPLSRYPRGNIHVNGSMGGATYTNFPDLMKPVMCHTKLIGNEVRRQPVLGKHIFCHDLENL